MLTPSGAKLLDFGLGEDVAGRRRRAASLSAPGVVPGTLQYMAPEQLEGAEADARSDIFALGVIIHEMVTGKKVFEGKSRVLLMSAIATHTPPPLVDGRAATPPELEHVVATCLAKDPADRWQTARDVLAELQAIAEGGTDGVTTTFGRHRIGARTSRLYRALAAAALLLAVGVSVPAFWLSARRSGAGRGALSRARSSSPLSRRRSASTAWPRARSSVCRVSPCRRTAARWRSSRGPTANDAFTLYVRPLGALAPQPLTADDDGAAQPFWSADGRRSAFVVGRAAQEDRRVRRAPAGPLPGERFLRRRRGTRTA